MATRIHPSAVVDDAAILGEDCEIGAFCFVGPGVTMGPRNRLHNHVSIQGPTTIGEGNTFYPFASIGSAPQDLKYAGEPTRLVVGDRNVFREGTVANRGTVGGGGLTTIGSDGLFMQAAHVAHDCHVGDHVIFANSATLAGHVTVEEYVTIGGLTPVQQFVRIGAHAFIGGATRVAQDIVPYIKMGGIPPVVLGCNHVGLSRRGFSPDAVKGVQEAIRILFRSGLNTAQAVATLRGQGTLTPEVERLVRFVETAERGILRN